MKLFRVDYEVDGLTVKAPGISETQLKRVTEWFAADSLDAVWDYIKPLRDDPEKMLMAVGEAAPLITVLPFTLTQPTDPT